MLSQLADRTNVTLRIYNRLVDSLEQRKIIQNATRRNKLMSGGSNVQETIDAEVNGEPLNIAFNVAYLTDAMKMFDSGSVILHLNTSITPCVVCPTTTVSDFFWLILPVRTSA